MKKIILLLSLVTVLFGCSSLKSLSSFASCSFHINGVSEPTIASINLNNLADVSKMNVAQVIKITSDMISGDVPFSITADIMVENPNAVDAKLMGMDWIMVFNNTEVFKGQINQPLSVKANGRAVIPVRIEGNVMTFLKKDAIEDLKNFANGLLKIGQPDATVALKINPAIDIFGTRLNTGFITLKTKI